MAADPWGPWASFSALLDPAAALWGTGAFKPAASGFAPFVDAERFAAAARAFYQKVGFASRCRQRAFDDFLRDQFASVFPTAAPGARPCDLVHDGRPGARRHPRASRTMAARRRCLAAAR